MGKRKKSKKTTTKTDDLILLYKSRVHNREYVQKERNAKRFGWYDKDSKTKVKPGQQVPPPVKKSTTMKHPKKIDFVAIAKRIKDLGYSEAGRVELRMLYHQYLQTEEWQKIRNAVLDRDGHRCVRCGSKFNSRVHHTNYKHVYEEHKDLSLLITLCNECHEKEHGLDTMPEATKEKHKRKLGDF